MEKKSKVSWRERGMDEISTQGGRCYDSRLELISKCDSNQNATAREEIGLLWQGSEAVQFYDIIWSMYVFTAMMAIGAAPVTSSALYS